MLRFVKKSYRFIKQNGLLQSFYKLSQQPRSKFLSASAGYVKRSVLLIHQLLPYRVDNSIKVSVVIPVYNHSRYVKRCIDSVLAQSYVNIEIIAIDDCSTDEKTKEILNSYSDSRCRIFFNEKNLGITQTTNKAISLASGHYIAFLDCDDMLPVGSIRRIVKEATRNPGVDLFFTDKVRVDENDRKLLKDYYGLRIDLLNKPVYEALLEVMVASHLMVVKRTSLDHIGLFTTEVSGCQDYDIALRFAEIGRVKYVPGFLYLYRWHADAITSRDLKNQYRIAAQVRDRAVLRHYLRNWSYRPDKISPSNGKKRSILIIVPWLDNEMSNYISTIVDKNAASVHLIITMRDEATSDYCGQGYMSYLNLKPWWSISRKIAAIKEAFIEKQADAVHIIDSVEGYLSLPELWTLYPRPVITATLSAQRPGFISWIEHYQSYIDKVVAGDTVLEQLENSTLPSIKIVAAKKTKQIEQLYEKPLYISTDGLSGRSLVSVFIKGSSNLQELDVCLSSVLSSTRLPIDVTIFSDTTEFLDIAMAEISSRDRRIKYKLLTDDLSMANEIVHAEGQFVVLLDGRISLKENAINEVVVGFISDQTIGAGILHAINKGYNVFANNKESLPDYDGDALSYSTAETLVQGLAYVSPGVQENMLNNAAAFRRTAVAAANSLGTTSDLRVICTRMKDIGYNIVYLNAAVAEFTGQRLPAAVVS